MANSTIVEIPDRTTLNSGYSSPSEPFMLSVFGPPADHKTKDCNNDGASSRFKVHLKTAQIGPIKVTGFYLAIESLEAIVAEVQASNPQLLSGLMQDAMLCIRRRRPNTLWSNHAFGCAIDLKYTEKGIDQGDPHTFEGLVDLYPYFHKHKWYWGAAYKGKDVDAMHFETSTELVKEWEASYGPF